MTQHHHICLKHVFILPCVHSHDQEGRQMLQTQASIPRILHNCKKTYSLHNKTLHHFKSTIVANNPLSPLSPPTLWILATAERPPGNPSHIAFADHRMALCCLNKWNGAQIEKCCASSNMKHYNIDKLEMRSGFITSRLQRASPHSLWESGNTAHMLHWHWLQACFFFFLFFFSTEQIMSTHDTVPRYSMCSSASLWHPDFWPAVQIVT